jgi:hypothetical protein
MFVQASMIVQASVIVQASMFVQANMIVQAIMFVTDNRKDTSLLLNLSICRKLQIRKVL